MLDRGLEPGPTGKIQGHLTSVRRARLLKRKTAYDQDGELRNPGSLIGTASVPSTVREARSTPGCEEI